MIARVVVAAVGAVALLVSILGLSCVASEQRAAPAKAPIADVLRSAPLVESELDGASASELRPTFTF